MIRKGKGQTESAKPTAFCDEMASSVDVGTAVVVDHLKGFESATVSL